MREEVFVRQAVCHNNPLMVPTLPPIPDEIYVGARISLRHKPQPITEQMHSPHQLSIYVGLSQPTGYPKNIFLWPKGTAISSEATSETEPI